MNKYLDFSITIHPGRDGSFPVTISGPAGDGDSSFELPLGNAASFDERLNELQQSVQRGTTRGVSFAAPGGKRLKPRAVGELLYASIFHGTALELFEQSIRLVSQRKEGLRIKLRIDPADPSLAALNGLPWEIMCRPQTGEYLGLSNRNPLVRYLDVQRPCPSIPFRPPFRILVVISSPRGVAELDLDRERKLIEQSWGQRSDVQVDFLETATKSELQRQLGRADYHALHFMGHGEFDAGSGRGVLVLETADNDPDQISGKALGVLLADEPTLRLVFLNACNTAQSSADSDQNPFAGVATALVLAGVPVVVAMQYPITDEAAIAFSRKFYELLPECYPLDYVVAEARKEVHLQDSRETTEWATPAVFMRSPDGMIFKSVYGRELLSPEQTAAFASLTTKVNRFWIEGKLDVDVPIKPPIELNKELVPKAVQTKFGGSTDAQLVPAGKTIATVFDESERSLLILGNPGFGKTTSLLALAQYLIRRHNQDPAQPIPVVLHLSSWTGSGLSIEDWAVLEVLEKYKVSDDLFRQWLVSGRIVLMLDGLNEVPEDRRPDCIDAVNEFFRQQISRTSFSGVAVCCRFNEYQQLPTRLNLEGAIRLQPLTEAQIREYLDKFGTVMHGLQEFLDENPRLLKDASEPLMLGMMSVAYRLDPARFSDVAQVASGGQGQQSDTRRKILVDAYLDHAFAHAGGQTAPYSRSTVTAGLTWLARRLKQRHQSIFLIENLQPDWLRNRREQILNAAIYALALGSVVAAAMWVVWRTSNEVNPSEPESFGSHPWWFVVSAPWAFAVALFEWIQYERGKQKIEEGHVASLTPGLMPIAVQVTCRTILYYLIWMILWMAVCRLVRGQWFEMKWLGHPIQGGVSCALLYAARTVTNNNDRYIGTSEMLVWSWGRAVKGMLIGVTAGLVIWLAYWFVHWGSSFFEVASHLSFYPPLGAVVGLMVGGLKMGAVKSKTRANEGVILSLRNSLWAMAAVGTVIGASLVPILMNAFPGETTGIRDNFVHKLFASFWLGIGSALVMFLWFGGIDVMRHYSLRLTLFLTGQLPLRLPRFLDYLASPLGLLQKIGGSYIFRNNLLLDYFAKQPERPIWSREPAGPPDGTD